jgi:hypothetical protein
LCVCVCVCVCECASVCVFVCGHTRACACVCAQCARTNIVTGVRYVIGSRYMNKHLFLTLLHIVSMRPLT